MIAHVAVLASCVWLGMMGLAVLCTRDWRPAGASPSLALRGERPAVVSLLAGQLHRAGYPATLLDLAARGWFTMTEVEPGRVMCGITAQDDTGLTAYERLAVSHLAFRARATGSAPGAALGSGFELGDQEFHELFVEAVQADARQLGLTRRRLSGKMAGLLSAAAVFAATLTLTALAGRGRAGSEVFAAFGCLILWGLPWALYLRARRTQAGTAALAEWLGFRAALTGSSSRPTAGSALVAVGGDRRIAYAAALGAAPDAVAAFATEDNFLWSSYGGSWRRVALREMHEPYVPGTGALIGITAMVCLIATMTLVVATTAGLRWGAAFAVLPGCILWFTAWWVYRCSARARQLPPVAEFDGQILRRWSSVVKGGENPDITYYCIAIDDGERDETWTLSVDAAVYAGCRVGMLIHVQVDPRRNQLIALSAAAGTAAPAGE